MVSVLVAVEKKYTMIRIGKLVAMSILDDEGSKLEVDRMARREEKADNEVSKWEPYASRLQQII
jgi:hypothetical protein